MIRDRDGCYDRAVTKRLAAMGTRDHPIAASSSWHNGHAERLKLIGSIRREYFDQVVVFGETHLRRIPAAYAVYYHCERICPWARIRHAIGRPGAAASSLLSRPSTDLIINIVGSGFWRAQWVQPGACKEMASRNAGVAAGTQASMSEPSASRLA
jgi:hypothetical protein